MFNAFFSGHIFYFPIKSSKEKKTKLAFNHHLADSREQITISYEMFACIKVYLYTEFLY